MMRDPLTSETLWKITQGRGSIELRAEDFPGLVSALKIREGLERELIEHRKVVKQTEKDLREVSETENWSLVKYLCEKLEANREEIRKIENHLKEGL